MEYIANAKVGDKTVRCLISPSFDYSVISIDLLKKLNLEYKNSKDKYIYIGGSEYIHPLGVAIIPIQFKDKERNVTIDSEIYICNKNKNISKNTILLDYDWLVGGSVLHESLQIYSIKLVHEFEWGGGVETYLSIRGIGSDSEQKLYKKLKTYDLYDSSDDSDDSDDDSDDYSKLSKKNKYNAHCSNMNLNQISILE